MKRQHFAINGGRSSSFVLFHFQLFSYSSLWKFDKFLSDLDNFGRILWLEYRLDMFLETRFDFLNVQVLVTFVNAESGHHVVWHTMLLDHIDSLQWEVTRWKIGGFINVWATYHFKWTFQCKLKIIHQMREERMQENIALDVAVHFTEINCSVCQDFSRQKLFREHGNLNKFNFHFNESQFFSLITYMKSWDVFENCNLCFGY